MRCLQAAVVALACAAGGVPVGAKDLGFNDLVQTIVDATQGSPALVPFNERPVVDEGFEGVQQGFGFLGSVTNPRIAYPGGGRELFYYRPPTDEKCNPDKYRFPAGQRGLDKFSFQKFFKFEVKGGQVTVNGGSANDKVFNLNALEIRVLRRVKVTITDLKEYTLDFRTLRERVSQVSAIPGCDQYRYALTKVYEGKVAATYYFEAGAEAGIKADIGSKINIAFGLAAVTQTGASDADPNVLEFQSGPRMFAAKFRTVTDILDRRPVARTRRVAAGGN